MNNNFSQSSFSDGGNGSTIKKIDYEAIEAIITQIDSAIDNIGKAIEDKIKNVTYISGNAKGDVDAYIDKINTSLVPIKPSLEEIRNKISEIRETYMKVETKIGSSLGTSSSSSDGNSIFSKTSM